MYASDCRVLCSRYCFVWTLLAALLFGSASAQAVASVRLVVTSASSVTAKEGASYETIPLYRITTDGSAVWFDAMGLPTGLYLNRNTGEIKGVPATGTAGTYSVALSAQVNSWTVASSTLVIKVEAVSERSFVVTSTGSSASTTGTLAWAIAQANLSSIPARITFNLQPAGAVQKIVLSERQWINEKMVIDGRSQPGYKNAPLVQIDVNGKENAFTVLGPDRWHKGGGGSTFAGLQIFNFTANAIATQPYADGVNITDNYIGFYWDFGKNRWWRNFEAGLSDDTIQNGTTSIYNGFTQAVGIGIQSSSNHIERNVISGVHNGISIGYDFEGKTADTWGPANIGNIVSENRVGTTPDGTAILTNTQGAIAYLPTTVDANPFGFPAIWKFFGNNSDGIYLSALAKSTVISNNISSGNFSSGIELLHETVEQSQVYGNKLGVDISTDTVLPNGELGMILSNGAHHNIVGGEKGANIVAGNYFAGIELGGANSFKRSSYNIVQGNLIGCNSSCTKALDRQTTGIHAGTPDARMNVIEGNTVVNQQWGIYIDKGNDNVVSNNYVGVTRAGKAIGNAKSGIVIDNGWWNTTMLNHVENNGYGITGHEDWSFGIWELQGGSNRYFDNALASNRTASNAKDSPLPAGATVDPTESIHLSCIELAGNFFRVFLTKQSLGQSAGKGSLWSMNPASIEGLPVDHHPAACLKFSPTFSIDASGMLGLGTTFTSLSLDFQTNSSSSLIWKQR